MCWTLTAAQSCINALCFVEPLGPNLPEFKARDTAIAYSLIAIATLFSRISQVSGSNPAALPPNHFV